MRKVTREMTKDPVVLRIMDQLKLQGKTEKELVTHLGMSSTTFSSWKFENVKTYRKNISAIAEFLDVTEAYLLEGLDDFVNKDTMTGLEIKLVKLFRSMGNEEQKCFMEMGQLLIKSTKYDRMGEIMSDS